MVICLLIAPIRTTRARQDTFTNVSPPSDYTHGISTNNSVTTMPLAPPSNSVINHHNLHVNFITTVNAHMPNLFWGPLTSFLSPKELMLVFLLPDTVVSPIID